MFISGWFSKFSFLLLTVLSCEVVEAQDDLSALPKLIESFLKASPEEKHIDGKVILSAHEQFIELLDPQKEYFFQKEVDAFLDPAKEQEFVHEVENGSFHSFVEMTKTFQKALKRAYDIRKQFFGMTPASFKCISVKPTNLPQTFARDQKELQEKVIYTFAMQVQQKMASGQEQSFRQTVLDVEKCIETSEENLVAATCKREKELAQSILKSILKSLDVNSDVMGKKDARNMREKLTKEAFGTGILCYESNDIFYIGKIQEGSPAAEKKLFHEGDVLLSINHKPCSAMTLDEIDGLLSGKGMVHLVYERSKGKILEADVATRPFVINEGRVQKKIFKTPCGDVLVLTIPMFYGNEHGLSVTKDIEKNIEDAKRQNNIAGIILDLRGNMGGYVSEAISTCGLFIKTGVVMMALYADGEVTVYRDLDTKIIYDGPMLILTSEMTASAAEIVTLVLKDYGKAIVVGSKTTFGKGSIQMQTVTNDAMNNTMPLKYTVGKFYSVSGISPNGIGIEADISLPGIGESPASSHAVSAASLPERISPHFQDSLSDITPSARPWYVAHYSPFIQKREERYRKCLPLLRQKSQERLNMEFPRAQPRNYGERKALEDSFQQAQLQEALNILTDLISVATQ